MVTPDVIASPSTYLSNKPYLYSLGFLLIFAMHYYQPNGGGAGLSLAFNNTTWIGISLVIATGLWRIAKAGRVNYSLTEILFSIALISLSLPFLWAQGPWREAAYDRYLGFLAIGLILLAHRQFRLSENEQGVFWGLVCLAVLIQCVVGLVQFFHAGEWLIIPNGRPPGIFQQVNVYASFLATGLAISLYQFFSQLLKRELQVLYLLVIFGVILMQMLVLSRTGLLGSVLVLISFTWLYRRQIRKLLLVYGLVLAAVIAAFALQQTTQTEGRSVESAAKPGYRITQYSLSWELIKERPLLGHGLGKFQTVYLDKQAEAYSQGAIEDTHGTSASSHPHNELLFWWVEAGVIPVLTLILICLVILFILFRDNRPGNKAILLCLLPLVLHTQTEFPLYHSAIHLALMALILAQLPLGKEKCFKIGLGLMFKVLASTLVIFTFAFAVTNLHSMYLLNRFVISKEPDYLSRMVNRLGQRREINRHISQQLIEIQTPQALSLAREMLVEEVQLRPSEGAYAFYYKTLQLMDEPAKAEFILKKALYLFPQSEYFKQSNSDNF